METVEIEKETDQIRIYIMHNETGSCYGITMSCEAYAQLEKIIISQFLNIQSAPSAQ